MPIAVADHTKANREVIQWLSYDLAFPGDLGDDGPEPDPNSYVVGPFVRASLASGREDRIGVNELDQP